MVVIQNSINDVFINERDLVNTLQQVITDLDKGKSELLIRIVDKAEIQDLNNRYRHKNSSTNVLSFPSEIPVKINEAIGETILGDVVICTEVVREEAEKQNKTFDNHLIHIAVHGTLHLLGYDHIKNDDAETMEAMEVKILSGLEIKNPY